MKEIWPQTARALTARADSSPCLDRGMNVVVIGCDLYNGQLTGDIAVALTAKGQCAGQSGPRALIVYPINTMVATRGGKDDMRTCFGIGEPNDPQFTISAAHSHGVCYERQNEDE